MPTKVLRRRKETPVKQEPKQEAEAEEEEEEEPKPKSKPHDKIPEPSHWLFRKLF